MREKETRVKKLWEGNTMKNVKKGASLGAIIGVAFAFMTTFFGGGWATGAQTGAYATQHGWTAIWAPLLGVAGIVLAI